MFAWAIRFLPTLLLSVQASRTSFGLGRTRRAPSWRSFSQSMQKLAVDIRDAEPHIISAGTATKVRQSSISDNDYLAPEQYLIAQKIFSTKLDKDGNGVLSKPEFLSSVLDRQIDARWLEVGKEIFSYFSPNGDMTQTQFFRFFAICIVDPEEGGARSFVLKTRRLTGLTTGEQSCLAKLFIILDDNGDGEVDKAEFEKGHDGTLLRQLRKQGYVNCGPSDFQLQEANRKFEEYSGGEPLSIDQFYELTAEVAGEKPKPLTKSASIHLLSSARLIGGAILTLVYVSHKIHCVRLRKGGLDL